MSKYPGRIVTDLAPAGYSVFFDGTGDYLSNTANTIIPTTGDFTFETWVYPTQVSTLQFLIGTTNNSGNKFFIYIGSTAYVGVQTGSSFRDSSTTKVVANAWNHIACTRTGSTYALFVNGVVQSISGSGTMASTLDVTPTYIGSRDAGNSPVTGYLSNVRVCNSVLYTAAFTPPTQLLNITNTSLLTCNSPALVDQSINNFTITANGNAAVSTLTPFPAYVPYNPALGASTPGVWTVDEAMQAATTRQWNMYDPYFNLTTLLLHGNQPADVTDTNNNVFKDSSSNNFSITRNGNTTQGSFSPFNLQPGTWSVFFNAANFTDIYAASSADFNFGSGDFTIECFFNSSNAMSTAAFWRLFDTGQLTCFFFSGSIYLRNAATNELVTPVAHGLSVGVWYHLAIVRSGTTYSIYRDGSLLTSGTGGTVTSASASFVIGTNTSWNQPLSGHVSNFRVTTGQALYTTTFTPTTTPLTTTSQSATASNVKLLTCQSNRFVDNSTQNTKTILFGDGTSTNLGVRFVQPFSPFYPTAAYTPETIGGSGYFDGTGDYLSLASNTLLNPGAGDFTIEAWIYPTNSTTTAEQTIIGYGTSSTNLRFQVNNTRDLRVLNGATVLATGSLSITPNSWQHVAVIRSGTGTNNVKLYVNGVQVAQNATANTTSYAGTARIGDDDGTRPFFGYISGLRLVKGQALATGAFTPPTAPLTPTSIGWTDVNAATSITGSVNLLTNFTNAGVIDSTAKNVLETVGNAQISTTQSKFGGSSMYFDGTGDYLQTAPSQLFNVGASDFTIEFWIYPTSFASTSYPMYSTTARAKSDVLAFEVGTAGTIVAYVTASGGGAWSIVGAGNIGTLTLNAWNHVALVRNGSAFRGYVNGVQGGMTTSSSSAVASFDGWNIGFNGASAYFTGYIDDLRITRFARYTGAFTPQTSQWQDQ